jgi:uncharacterized protein (TIGR00290 family)
MSADVGLAGRRFFCSWSGGKDAYLALRRAVAGGGHPAALLCMLEENGAVSRGHGLPLAVLRAQAASLGVPLLAGSTNWEGYEECYVAALGVLRGKGVEAGVFGDIDLQGHRDWVEGVCRRLGMSCHLPLWEEPREALVRELIDSGVTATVVATNESRLGEEFLGRRFDDDLLSDLREAAVDLCGEEGEYHTAVTDGPLFRKPVPLRWLGHARRDGHWVLNFAAAPAAPDHQEVVDQ